MKACVVTLCTWKSFGSVLQALGLKTALSSIGWDSVALRIGEDAPRFLHKPKTLKQLIRFPHDILKLSQRKKAFEKGRAFIKRNLDTVSYPDYAALCREPLSADAYIAGSDQIWNPRTMDPLFFIDFIKDTDKISYAASMGSTVVSPAAEKAYREYLSDFKHISVRERACAEILSSFTDKPIETHIDPTFFLNAEEWRKYEQAYEIKKPYILLYTIYRSGTLREEVKRLSRRTGLPVYAVKSEYARDYADRALYDVGPAEFLWLIDNAEYVVTSSFHGAALSIAFKKRFSPIVDPAAPSRIMNLLSTLGVPLITVDDLDGQDSFDYAAVDERIKAERNRGRDYLRRALG